MWSVYWLPAIIVVLLMVAIYSTKIIFGEDIEHIYNNFFDVTNNSSLDITVSADENVLCPLCKDLATDNTVSCEKCNTVFHKECLVEMGALCSTLGCLQIVRIKA